MIYLWIFFEFFKIGTFAIGGGLVTLPFLFELSERRGWFSKEYIADSVALTQSIPGPIGINASVFAGFETAGTWGGIAAAAALVTPAIIAIMALAKFLKKYGGHKVFQDVLKGIYPAVIALILMAFWDVANIAIINIKSAILCLFYFVFLQIYKKTNIALFVLFTAMVGITLGYWGIL